MCELSATVTVSVLFPEPSKDTEPDASPASVIVLSADHFDAVAAFPEQEDDVEAFPESAAVIVPAEKFPLASRFTIVFAVLSFVASDT